MEGAIARGFQAVNSKFLKTVLGKSYHQESSHGEFKRLVRRADGAGEEPKYRETSTCHGHTLWIPHPRTGIYYPKGQEKLMEDVPSGAANLPQVHHSSGMEYKPRC